MPLLRLPGYGGRIETNKKNDLTLNGLQGRMLTDNTTRQTGAKIGVKLLFTGVNASDPDCFWITAKRWSMSYPIPHSLPPRVCIH